MENCDNVRFRILQLENIINYMEKSVEAQISEPVSRSKRPSDCIQKLDEIAALKEELSSLRKLQQNA